MGIAQNFKPIHVSINMQSINLIHPHIQEIHFRPVITRWSGSTSRMRVIGEARNANLLSQTRLIAVSVVYWWVGNLYDVCIGLTELCGLSQSPCKME